MEKLEIYPNRHRCFEGELRKLEKDTISDRNRELITLFQNYLFSTGSGELRVAKLSSQLRRLCRWLEKALNVKDNLDKLEKNDIMNLVSHINRLNEKSIATRSDYKRALKQFYRWFRDEDERVYSKDEEVRIKAQKFYNYLEKEISSKYKNRQADPNTIITDDDILKVIEGCNTPREKAFLSLLHESGCRAAEFLNLKVGHIIIKENYGEVHVPDGKTGKRIIYITRSIPYIIKYLENHPFKNNNNSFLWLTEAQATRGEPLLHIGGQRLIDRCFNRANLSKKHNWHWFRHSRATILAPKLTEVMLCKYMGWTIGSRQVSNYVHLCSKQLEDVMLSINGIKPTAAEEEKPIQCICGTLNNPNERYCFKCYKPLKVESLIQDQEIIRNEMDERLKVYAEVMSNPEKKRKFEEFKKMFFEKEN